MQFLPQDDNFWVKVIFSDKIVFQSTYNGRIQVYRHPNMRFEEKYTQKKKCSGRFSVNVWGWISCYGAGLCWNIDGTMNSKKYILEKRLILLMLFLEKIFSYFHKVIAQSIFLE